MTKNWLGMKPGESIPMERHGEAGRLYNPVVQLTEDELRLYAKVSRAWGERDLGTREAMVALVTTVAEESGASNAMTAHVIAYLDEMHAAPWEAHGEKLQ